MADDGWDRAKWLFEEVSTEAEALKYMRRLVVTVVDARKETDKARTVERKRSLYQTTLILYGRAMGALGTLMHCRKLSPVAYNQFHTELHAALAPSMVEVAPATVRL